jgi:hypothetical protein
MMRDAAPPPPAERRRRMRRLVMLNALVLLSGCGAAISERPCPRVTEFPAEIQQQAVAELATAPALARMMDAMAADRAFNRAICR